MGNFSFAYETFENINKLDTQKKQLVENAIGAVAKAYAPYSKFNVGCAVLIENGRIILGSNVENASYPVGICAERNALSHVMSNYPTQKITSIAISYQSEKNAHEVIFPCGMCRQFIYECQLKNESPIELISHAPKGKIIVLPNAGKLLPFGFSGEVL